MTKGVKDWSGLFVVERRAYHAARPGFRIVNRLHHRSCNPGLSVPRLRPSLFHSTFRSRFRQTWGYERKHRRHGYSNHPWLTSRRCVDDDIH